MNAEGQARAAKVGHCWVCIAIEQLAQLSAAAAVEVFWREEKKKLPSLQGLFSLLLEFAVLGTPHLIDRFVEMFRDVEGVMHNLGRRHLGFGRSLKSRAHVHDDGFHLLTLFGPYTFEKSLGTGSLPTFGDFQHPRAFGITQHRNVTLAAQKALLIDAHRMERSRLLDCDATKSK